MNTLFYLLGLIVFFILGYFISLYRHVNLKRWVNTSKGDFRHLENDYYYIGELNVRTDKKERKVFAFTQHELDQANQRYKREFE